MTPVLPSTRACSVCSGSRGCPPWSWCRAACRPARAGVVRTMLAPPNDLVYRQYRSLRCPRSGCRRGRCRAGRRAPSSRAPARRTEMTVAPGPQAGRISVPVDPATRIVRLLAWTAMLAVCCPIFLTHRRHGGTGGESEGGSPRDRPGRGRGGRRDRKRCIEGRHGAGLCRDGCAGEEPDRRRHGRCEARERLADPG